MALLVLGLLVAGWPYYVLPHDLRLDHPLHDWFRPGGFIGLWTGILGSALMLAMLSYTVRKFFLGWSWLGAPTLWLRFHIVCGIAGPALIVLHTSFLWPDNFVKIAFWSMLTVAFSGVFGRYVYGHFPRTAAGRSQELTTAMESLAELKASVVERSAGMVGPELTRALKVVRSLDREARSLWGWLLLHMDVQARADQVDVLLVRSGLPVPERLEVRDQLVAQLYARRNVEGWEVTSRLFRWWHLLHEPLAKAMYLLAFLHVIEVLVFGGILDRLFVMPIE
jgi:hypothetical protein